MCYTAGFPGSGSCTAGLLSWGSCTAGLLEGNCTVGFLGGGSSTAGERGLDSSTYRVTLNALVSMVEGSLVSSRVSGKQQRVINDQITASNWSLTKQKFARVPANDRNKILRYVDSQGLFCF